MTCPPAWTSVLNTSPPSNSSNPGSNEIVSFDGDLSYNSLAEFLQENAGHKLTLEPKPVAAAPVTPEHDHEDDSEEGEHMEL